MHEVDASQWCARTQWRRNVHKTPFLRRPPDNLPDDRPGERPECRPIPPLRRRPHAAAPFFRLRGCGGLSLATPPNCDYSILLLLAGDIELNSGLPYICPSCRKPWRHVASCGDVGLPRSRGPSLGLGSINNNNEGRERMLGMKNIIITDIYLQCLQV